MCPASISFPKHCSDSASEDEGDASTDDCGQHLMPLGTPHSDVFRPRLPLDPFDGVDLSEPWLLDPTTLALSSVRLRRDVVLVLGAPKTEELLALLTAHTLAYSLLIIVTHEPPIIDFEPPSGPTVRVLRLGRPLAAEDQGSLRLVSVLEHAEAVARQWRGAPDCIPAGLRRYAVLGADEDGEFSVVEEHQGSPPSSQGHGPPTAPRSAASSRRHSLLSALSDRTSIPRAKIKAYKEAACGRPFDAIVNYLPSLAEKLVIKQAILVTTVSQPFLTSPTGPYRSSEDKSKLGSVRPLFAEPGVMSPASAPPSPALRRRSLFRSPSPDVDLFAVAPPARSAHILHIVHPGCAANRPSSLMQSITQFLLSFSEHQPPVVSYLVSGGVLGYTPPGADLSVAEIALAGLLDKHEDDEDVEDVPVGSGFLRRYAQKYKMRTKAVIESLSDMSVAGADPDAAHHQHVQDGMIYVYTRDGVREYDCDEASTAAAFANAIRRSSARALTIRTHSNVSGGSPSIAGSIRTSSPIEESPTPPVGPAVPFPRASSPSNRSPTESRAQSPVWGRRPSDAPAHRPPLTRNPLDAHNLPPAPAPSHTLNPSLTRKSSDGHRPLPSDAHNGKRAKRHTISRVGEKILRRSTTLTTGTPPVKRPSIKRSNSLRRGNSVSIGPADTVAIERGSLAVDRDNRAVERDNRAAERDSKAAERERVATQRDGQANVRSSPAIQRDSRVVERGSLANDRPSKPRTDTEILARANSKKRSSTLPAGIPIPPSHERRSSGKKESSSKKEALKRADSLQTAHKHADGKKHADVKQRSNSMRADTSSGLRADTLRADPNKRADSWDPKRAESSLPKRAESCSVKRSDSRGAKRAEVKRAESCSGKGSDSRAAKRADKSLKRSDSRSAKRSGSMRLRRKMMFWLS